MGFFVHILSIFVKKVYKECKFYAFCSNLYIESVSFRTLLEQKVFKLEEKSCLSQIANEMLLVEESLKASGGNFTSFFYGLKEKYFKDELAEIFSLLLQKSTDTEFLKVLIKEIDALRAERNLDDLLDFLLVKDSHAISGEELSNFTDVRVLCLKAISNYKETRSITPILYCLNNKNEHYKFRLAAAEALGKIGDKNAVEPLIDVVSDENEKSIYVRESAAIALGMIGDMRAVDPFLSILEAKKNFLDKFTFLKERVIEALGKIDFASNKRVISVFKNALLDESPQVRLNAVESLMNSNCEEASGLIKDMLYDPDEEVARSSVIALYNLDGKKALEEVLALENVPYYCKEEAREILAEEETSEEEE